MSNALRSLTLALDEPGIDLSEMFDALIGNLAAAVPSLVAVKITVDPEGRPVTISSPPRSGATIETTVSFPLPTAGVYRSLLVLAASTPGAFTELAHEAVTELGVAGDIHHDAHLSAFDELDEPDMNERSDIDVAVGVLLDKGSFTPASALTQLTDRAARDGLSLLDAARATIAEAGESLATDQTHSGDSDASTPS